MLIATAAKSLGVALAIGVLVGVERERRKGDGIGRGAAGVRTFALAALAGGIAKLTGEQALIVMTAVMVVGGALLSYFRTNRADPGLTTEVALVVTYLLGILSVEQTALAAGLGVTVAVVLASRTRLHRFARETLSAQELEDLLIFAASALVVLPLLPRQGIGPNGALNLFTMWRLVVIIMAVNGAGYIALRIMGARYGLSVAGFVSGFVSSAATIASLGSRSKNNPSLTTAAVTGAVLSSVATVLQMILVVGATSPPVLRLLLPPMIAAGFVSLIYSAIMSFRMTRAPLGETLESGRAFHFRSALLLGVTVSAVMILSSTLLYWFGQRGLVLAAGLAGFADTHAAAISTATLAASGATRPGDALFPILLAFTTNTLTKIFLAWTSGTREYTLLVSVGVSLMAAAAWLVFALK